MTMPPWAWTRLEEILDALVAVQYDTGADAGALDAKVFALKAEARAIYEALYTRVFLHDWRPIL